MGKIINQLLLIFIISFINLTTLNAQNCLIDVPSDIYNACPGNPTNLEFSIDGGVTTGPFEYYYSVDGGDWIMVTGSNPHSIDISSAGTYVVQDCWDTGTGLQVGINGEYDTEIISSLPIPSVSITPDPAITSINTDLTLNSNTSGGTLSYASTTWTDLGLGNISPTNLQNTIFNTAAPDSYSVTYQVTDDNGCVVTDNVNVTVINLQASIITPTDPVNACISNAVAIDGEALNGSGSYNYSWSYASGGTGTFSSTIIEDPTFTPNAVDTYTLTFTVTDVGIVPNVSASTTLTITVNSLIADAGFDQSLCTDTTYLDGNNPINGEGSWSVISGATFFENDNLFNTKLSGLSQGENILRWTVSNGTCSLSDDVTITNLRPTIANAGLDQVVCTNSATLSSNMPTVGVGTWTVLNGSGMFEDETFNDLTVTGLAQGENIFRWTISNKSCSLSDEVIITNRSPTIANAGLDQVVCTNTTTLSSNMPMVGVGTWSILNGSGMFHDDTFYNSTVTNLAQGENILRWTISNGICSLSDEVTVTNNLPELSIDIPDNLTCANKTVMLHANAENVSYNWTYNSPANIIGFDTIVNPIVNQPGTYILTVTDTIKACANIDSVAVLQGEVLNPGICMLSVDSLNHNVIIWNQINDLVYDSIFIYKETSVANNYAKIGSQSAKDLSLYEDIESNSAQNPCRYKISIIDTCGFETSLSEYHKTLHLTINLGLNGERNLIWNPYEGFEYSKFNIYRGTNNRDLVLIAEQVSNTFTDLNHAGGKNYYQIEIVNPNPCNVDNSKLGKSYYESTKSNIVSTEEEVTSIFNLKKESILIYPNPAKDKLYFKSEIFIEGIFVSILTIEGKLIKTEEIINSNTEIDISNLNVGMYVLRLNFYDNLIHKKFIKQ